jgi:mono/diheme cytochrome c family protein
MIVLLRIVVLAALLANCAAPQPPAAAEPRVGASDLAEDGREIAETQCSTCHAVGTSGESPNPAAPHFRTLLSRYTAEVLEQELIEGIRVAHPMPEFQFDPKGTDALIVYLQSIQQPPLAPSDPRAQRPRHVDE